MIPRLLRPHQTLGQGGLPWHDTPAVGRGLGDKMIYMMSLVDVISIIAAGLVFTTFALPPKRWLTAIAVATNCAFVGYGLYLGLLPVWLMHMIIIGLHLLRYDLGIGRVKRGKHHA